MWEDDFSDPESGFFVGESPDRAFWYEDGQYRIETRQTNWLAWTFLGYDLNDVQLSVDLRLQNGTGASSYGLLCRQQGEGNFYGFEFSEDGYYTIWLRYNEEYTDLVAWTYDERLDSTQWQQMTIECVGEKSDAHAERRGAGKRKRRHPHIWRCGPAGRIRRHRWVGGGVR